MFKKTLLAAALCACSAYASADIVLDFTGVGNGASVLDFYNGGTDSAGNSGINYGLRFNGGTVVYGSNGAVVRGPFSISFRNPEQITSVSAMAAQTYAEDGAYAPIYTASSGNTIADMNFADYTINPFCRSLATCQPGYEDDYIPPDRLYQFRWLVGFSDVTLIGFPVSLADNLSFVSSTLIPPRGNDNSNSNNGRVPEPGTLALVGLGLAGALMARRRRS